NPVRLFPVREATAQVRTLVSGNGGCGGVLGRRVRRVLPWSLRGRNRSWGDRAHGGGRRGDSEPFAMASGKDGSPAGGGGKAVLLRGRGRGGALPAGAVLRWPGTARPRVRGGPGARPGRGRFSRRGGRRRSARPRGR